VGTEELEIGRAHPVVVGLADWVAADDDGYVDIAAAIGLQTTRED